MCKNSIAAGASVVFSKNSQQSSKMSSSSGMHNFSQTAAAVTSKNLNNHYSSQMNTSSRNTYKNKTMKRESSEQGLKRQMSTASSNEIRAVNPASSRALDKKQMTQVTLQTRVVKATSKQPTSKHNVSHS